MTDAHVLVVDDDELHRELVADYLTLGGFAVRQARDGKEALALMGQEVPALVMLDVQMPELDGVAVVAAMRRDAALAEVPVLFLSGVAAPHLRSGRSSSAPTTSSRSNARRPRSWRGSARRCAGGRWRGARR